MDEPRLDWHLHSVLHTVLSPDQVAALYRPLGWRVRNASWEGREIRCAWAELVIDDAGYLLMHGPIADALAHVEELFAPLRSAGIPHEAEVYSPANELVRQIAWGFLTREE